MSPDPTDPTDPATPDPAVPYPGYVHYPVHPDLLAYARQTLDLEAEERDLRELMENGGVSVEQLLADIDAIVRGGS